jgi:DNA-binding NarL/FixJ family response regulator
LTLAVVLGYSLAMITAEQAVEIPLFVKLPPPAHLTDHQIHIVTLLACGKSSKQVAGDLELSVKTVETHRTLIYRALGIHHIAELTLYAVRAGWVRVV